MKVGILGTGGVGRALAEGFVREGHGVLVGTRDVDELMARSEPDRMGTPPFAQWLAEHPGVAVGTFSHVGEHAELLVNATLGSASVDVLREAGLADAPGRIVIDASNALDHSGGFPPSLFVVNTDSLAEQIQREFPDARVVKAWNTMTASLMTNPGLLAGGEHSIPICGNDDDARRQVADLLRSFGWRDVVDLGDLTAARGMEAYVLFWLGLYGAAGSPLVNVKIVR
jgi:8-hydroxy-5-deazaflavin:NADPH oxidoreductase